jgi:hypothetical protein
MTRADRARDVAAVVILLAGVALYAYAWLGMHNLAAQRLVAAKGAPLMSYFDTYWQLFRLARVVLLAGAAMLVWSFWRYAGRSDKSA